MALVLHNLLFGPERCVIVKATKLTRTRPDGDFSTQRAGRKRKPKVCDTCRKREDNCRCTFRHDWIVMLKALAMSTHMRRQPNYQRLSVAVLIMLTSILHHKSKEITDVALEHLRWTFSLTKTGNPFCCQPLDLLQEHLLVALIKAAGR